MDKVIVHEGFAGLLYEDGAFASRLGPGKHQLTRGFFARLLDTKKRKVTFIDLRQRTLVIKGQEILTADKVAIRVSLQVYYKVTDPEAAAHNVASYEDRIYEDVQLAARRFLASRELEAILGDRNEVSDTVRETVREVAASYGVEILRADVKDLIFPGNLREIMNRVLEVERQAEAKLIEAKKRGEAQRIEAESKRDADRLQLEAEKERVRLQAESARERKAIELETALAEAEALKNNPELLKLRELEVLRQMAQNGAEFHIGLKRGEVSGSLTDPD
ncbi:MAG: slipin family protein [Planctomycetota bacterium]|jgi:regulator of protease activity HflC (stomatin/prohibitin superfamily)